MKVAEILRSAEGGMKTHYLDLCCGLQQQGFPVTAYCALNDVDRKKLTDSGIRVQPFAMSESMHPFAVYKNAALLRRIMGPERPDVIHCHGFAAGLAGRLAATGLRLPWVYSVHNFVMDQGNFLRQGLTRLGEGLLSRQGGEIIAMSNALKDALVQIAGIAAERIHVIENGINLPKRGNGASIRQRYCISPDSLLVGTVARLIPSKGIEVLLQAAARLPRELKHLRFMILGSGPEEGRLRAQADRLALGNQVLFTGWQRNIADYYEAFDIFLLPTLSEGMGISILEAMAAGLPVLASRTGGIPEVIRHGQTGWLIPPGDSDQILEGLLYLSQNRLAAAAMGRGAKQEAEARFSAERMVERTAEVLRLASCLRGGRLRGRSLS